MDRLSWTVHCGEPPCLVSGVAFLYPIVNADPNETVLTTDSWWVVIDHITEIVSIQPLHPLYYQNSSSTSFTLLTFILPLIQFSLPLKLSFSLFVSLCFFFFFFYSFLSHSVSLFAGCPGVRNHYCNVKCMFGKLYQTCSIE